MTRILVVEDLAALRQHIGRLLAERIPGPPEVIEAEDGTKALELFRAQKPELIVMDISMPGMSGIKAAQQIWAENPLTKILFWSQYHTESYVRELGRIVPDNAIHGYVLKSESDEKLTYAIESVLVHNNPYIDPVVRGVQSRLQSKDESLTDVEYETFLDIIVGLTDKAIARRRHISVRGVQNRLSMLLNKLVADEQAHLKETAEMEIYNARGRIVFEGLRRGLIDMDSLQQLDEELCDWLDEEFDYRRS